MVRSGWAIANRPSASLCPALQCCLELEGVAAGGLKGVLQRAVLVHRLHSLACKRKRQCCRSGAGLEEVSKKSPRQRVYFAILGSTGFVASRCESAIHWPPRATFPISTILFKDLVSWSNLVFPEQQKRRQNPASDNRQDNTRPYPSNRLLRSRQQSQPKGNGVAENRQWLSPVSRGSSKPPPRRYISYHCSQGRRRSTAVRNVLNYTCPQRVKKTLTYCRRRPHSFRKFSASSGRRPSSKMS